MAPKNPNRTRYRLTAESSLDKLASSLRPFVGWVQERQRRRPTTSSLPYVTGYVGSASLSLSASLLDPATESYNSSTRRPLLSPIDSAGVPMASSIVRNRFPIGRSLWGTT